MYVYKDMCTTKLNDEINFDNFSSIISHVKQLNPQHKYNIIFDSDIDGNGAQVISYITKNKNKLYFIHFDDDKNVYGGYISTKLSNQYELITDSNAFLFSLWRNGEMTTKQYPIKYEKRYNSFGMCFNTNALYYFGQVGKYGKDILIFPIGGKPPFSIKCCYQYGSEKFPFFDNINQFNSVPNPSIQRIIILQMD